MKTKKEPEPIKTFEVKWQDTDIETLKFLHNEASVRVQDTVKDHYEISKKVFSLLLVVISLTTLIGGGILNYIFADKHFGTTSVLIVSFLFCLYMIYVLIYLTKPVKFMAPGREPKTVMQNDKINRPNVPQEERFKSVVYGELINCQNQIEMNQYVNTRRLTKIDNLLFLIMILLPVLSLMLVIVNIV